MSPSFIVDTWRIWEWLITIAFRIGLGTTLRVIPQAATPWGTKRSESRSKRISVYPDVAIYDLTEPGTPVFLVDAKCKTIQDGDTSEIERADLYEAFAFCRATGAKKLFLAYPSNEANEVGSGGVTNVSRYEVEDITIYAIKVAFGSITRQGDITSFCRTLSSEIMRVVE